MGKITLKIDKRENKMQEIDIQREEECVKKGTDKEREECRKRQRGIEKGREEQRKEEWKEKEKE